MKEGRATHVESELRCVDCLLGRDAVLCATDGEEVDEGRPERVAEVESSVSESLSTRSSTSIGLERGSGIGTGGVGEEGGGR